MGISTFFGLNVGMSALDMAQQAEAVISNNISNSNTPGYVQESAVLQEADPYPPLPSTNAPIMGGQLGQGVQVAQVQRLTSSFLNKQDRTNQSTSNMYDTLAQNLTQIEQIVNEPSSQSLQNALDNFFGSWQTLSTSPSSIPARQAVIAEGQTLGQTFQMVTTQLEDMQSNLTGTVQNQLQELNQYAQQVATLNKQIISINNMNQSGQPLVESPNQLEDQRGHVLDEMSQLANIAYTQNSDGSISVSIGSGTSIPGNIPLVSETTFYTLNTMSALPTSTSNPSFIVPGTGSAFLAVTSAAYSGTLTGGTGTSLDINLQYVSGGQIAGNVQGLDETNQVLAQMDSFLSTLANQVNSIQTSGYALGATTPSTISFFTLATTSANNVILQVNPTLTAQDVAAATGANLPGDNSNALLMVNNAWNGYPSTTMTATYSYSSLESNQSIPITSSSNATFDQMLTGYVSQLGIASAAANSNQQTADALSQQSSSLRQSVSGVDLNEQAAQMVEYQNLYSAAAKFISIVDSMLQTAINMIP